jgi:hypothetical protein
LAVVKFPSAAEIEIVPGAVALPGVTDNHGESLVALNIVFLPVTLTFTIVAAGFTPPNGVLNVKLDWDTDNIAGALPPPPHPAIANTTYTIMRSLAACRMAASYAVKSQFSAGVLAFRSQIHRTILP